MVVESNLPVVWGLRSRVKVDTAGRRRNCKGKTPVVSELWGATQQPWGRSLDILREGKEATKGIPWGRSLDNKLRIPTKSATLHVSYGTWELYLKIDKESKI